MDLVYGIFISVNSEEWQSWILDLSEKLLR
jgi:hypothetical protein